MKVIWKDDERTFGLAECLSTIAVWNKFKTAGEDYRKEVDMERLPYVVRRDIRGTTPNEVFDEFTTLFNELVKDISNYANEEDEFMQRVKEGSYSPIEDTLNAPDMIDAIGNVLVRKFTHVERMKSDDAYLKAKTVIEDVKVEMGHFLGLFLVDAHQQVAKAGSRFGIDPKDALAIKARVTGMDWHGLVVAIKRDDEYVILRDEERKDEGEDKSPENNPMYG